VNYRNEATSVIKSCLERYWRIEGEIAERYVSDRRDLGGGGSSSLSAELLVLRRKELLKESVFVAASLFKGRCFRLTITLQNGEYFPRLKKDKNIVGF
jgi:hypothetical protein